MLTGLGLVRQYKDSHKFVNFGDHTQERSAEKRKDRIRVYPCISLRCNERQREHNTMQRGDLNEPAFSVSGIGSSLVATSL